MGSTTIYTGSGSTTPQPMGDAVTRYVRYASTNFTDGANVTIAIEAKAELSCVDNGSGLTVPSPYTITCPTLNITNVAQNKLVTMAAQGDASVATIDKATAGEADGHMAAINHTTLAGSSPNFNVNGTGMATNLPLGTVFFAAVHGNTTGINDSVSGYSGGGTTFFSWDDLHGMAFPGLSRIGNTVVTGGSSQHHPLPYNMTISYTCSGFASSYLDAFDLDGDNQASAAFTGDIAVIATDQVTQTQVLSIADHAHLIGNELQSGSTLFDAVIAANSVIRTLEVGTGSGLPMSTDGDSAAKLKNVYKKSSEMWTILSGGVSTWYLVY